MQAIEEAIAAWDRAWNAGDCERLASFYSADAIAMGPNLPVTVGRDAIRASCKKDFEQFKEENHTFVEDLRIAGNLLRGARKKPVPLRNQMVPLSEIKKNG